MISTYLAYLHVVWICRFIRVDPSDTRKFQNPANGMNSGGSNSRNPNTMSTSKNFQMKRNQVEYGMRATPSTPMSTPEVGVIMLVKPSPNWKARTVSCRGISIKSDHSAIIGMVSAALAEPVMAVPCGHDRRSAGNVPLIPESGFVAHPLFYKPVYYGVGEKNQREPLLRIGVRKCQCLISSMKLLLLPWFPSNKCVSLPFQNKQVI